MDASWNYEMNTKEFWYGALASLVAAIVAEATGITEFSKLLRVPITVPRWILLFLFVMPVVLSLFWFRHYVSPAHAELKQSYAKVVEESQLLRTQLEDVRKTSSNVESTLASLKLNYTEVDAELKDWHRHGVKVFVEGDKIIEVAGKTFGPEVLDLDGKRFVNCIFNMTILKYRGVGPVEFNTVTFNDVRWVFDTPVSQAFTMLRALRATGSPMLVKMVDKTLDSVRSPETLEGLPRGGTK